MAERERDFAPLSMACVRGLSDKLLDKRKTAGIEIEKMVKDFNDAQNSNQLKRLIRVLGQDMMISTNPNVKIGALMGLSSVGVGLGKDCVVYLTELIQPMLACLNESPRVRYQAVEALFNVVKVARGAALAQLPALFDALARLAHDPELQVQQAADVLDRLLKDIVTESTELDMSAIIPLLRERIYSRTGTARQFVISWVSVLDAVPHVALVPALPELLDGLLKILDDPAPEIRRMCEIQLNEFLRSIKADPSAAHFEPMINILIVHAQSPEEMIQFTAISWLSAFAALRGARVVRLASGALLAALPCLAYADEPRRHIREIASTLNKQLMTLVGDADAETEDAAGDSLQLGAVVGVLLQLLHHSSLHTRVAVLDWLLHLYNKLPTEMLDQTEAVFSAAVGAVPDAGDDVARRALALLAEVCSVSRPEGQGIEASPYYGRLLRALLRLLAADAALLEDRAAFIIRQLCVLLDAEAVYRALSAALAGAGAAAGAGGAAGAGAGGAAGAGAGWDGRFVGTVVDVLSGLLLTAAELYELRMQLRRFDTPGTAALFCQLYACWAHSPVSLLALCLLTHNYAHCNHLINTFGDLEITVEFLTEVDKLVQLIESPVFAYLRLELLGGPASGELRAALFGLLMLLPQSEAFHALRRRLQCAPPPPAHGGGAADGRPDVDFAALLQTFKDVQNTLRARRRAPAPAPAPAPGPAPAPAPGPAPS